MLVFAHMLNCVRDTCMYTYYMCDMIPVAVLEKPSHPLCVLFPPLLQAFPEALQV